MEKRKNQLIEESMLESVTSLTEENESFTAATPLTPPSVSMHRAEEEARELIFCNHQSESYLDSKSCGWDRNWPYEVDHKI